MGIMNAATVKESSLKIKAENRKENRYVLERRL